MQKCKLKTIILAGSGHAHLEVIKGLTKSEIIRHQFILISPLKITYYSGLIPRFISGDITAEQLTIHSAEFAESKGFEFIQDSILSVDSKNNTVTLTSGKNIYFDILSLNTGGIIKKIPTESPFHTIYLRPFDDFIPRWPDIQKIFTDVQNPSFAVVGGGAAAVEVAVALKIRLNKKFGSNSEVHLITKGHRLCESYSEKISASIQKSLLKLNVQIHYNEPIDHIYSKHLIPSHSKKINFDLALILTPTETSQIISGKTDSMLRLFPNIFAMGDCVSMNDAPKLPRSGVVAVHQGRHLIENIRNFLLNHKLKNYYPKKKYLNILISGEKTAHFIWGRFYFEGKLALQIKKWIDKKYVKSFYKLDNSTLA